MVRYGEILLLLGDTNIVLEGPIEPDQHDLCFFNTHDSIDSFEMAGSSRNCSPFECRVI